MNVPKHRLAAVVMGSVIALFSLDKVERYRANQSPSGWHRTDDASLPNPGPAWKIGNSSWRLGPKTTWMSEQSHKQAYIRPKMRPESRIGITLSNHEGEPLWIWFNGQGEVGAFHNEESISCMGKIPDNTDVKAIELKTNADGLLVSRGDFKMVCPLDPEGDQPIQLRAMGDEVQLRAVGRDRKADGVPLSPLWWMSGLMALVFLWMIMFDILIGTMRSISVRLRPPSAVAEEE